MSSHLFKVGKTYNRRSDIHRVYKGQQYGGIATPSQHPYIFIFTGEAGEEYGYSDGFNDDGTFRYSGEGQVGDMQMSKGNLAILEHQKKNKEILLFEYVAKGTVRFLGTCSYITHHIEQRPDIKRQLRNAIVFHLDIQQPQSSDKIQAPHNPYLKEPNSRHSLNELRAIALNSTPSNLSPEDRVTHIRQRSRAIKLYTRKRANGVCEGCKTPSPFNSKSGPYLEVHHLTRLADGGPDIPENVIALCPNCHRKAHYSVEHLTFNAGLAEIALEIEKSIK